MAQKLDTLIQSEINSILADNTNGDISEEDLRIRLTDLLDSLMHYSRDLGTLAQLQAGSPISDAKVWGPDILQSYILSIAGGSTVSTDATTELKFTSNTTYHVGASEAALMGDITVNLTSAQRGNRIVMKHSGTAAPSFSGATFDQVISVADNYQVSPAENWLFFELADTAEPRILVSIIPQPLASTYEALPIGVGDITPLGTADGATKTTKTSSDVTWDVVEFAVATPEKVAFANFSLPKDYDPNQPIRLKLRLLTEAGVSGTVSFGVSGAAFADGIGAYPSFGTEQVFSATIVGTTGSFQKTFTVGDLDIAGTPGPEYEVKLKIVFKNSSAGTCNLIGLLVDIPRTREAKAVFGIPTDPARPSTPVLVENSETSDGGTYTISTPGTHGTYPVKHQFLVDGLPYGGYFSGTTPTLTGLAPGSYQVSVRAIVEPPNDVPIGSLPSNEEALTVAAASNVPDLSAMSMTDEGCWYFNARFYPSAVNAMRIIRDSDNAEVDVPFDANDRPTVATIESHAGVSLPVTRGRVGDLRIADVYEQSTASSDLAYDQGTSPVLPELHYDPDTGLFFAHHDGSSNTRAYFNENPNTVITQEAQWFTLVRMAGTPAGTTRIISSFATSNEHHLSQYSDGRVGAHAGGTVLYETSSNIGSDTVYNVKYDGASSYLIVNGVQEATGDIGSESHEDMTVGSNSNANGQYMNGAYYGHLVTKGMSNADRDTLNTFLIDETTV